MSRTPPPFRLFGPAPLELASERLLLRRWRDADAEAFARLSADLRVMRYFDGPRPHARTLELVARTSAEFEQLGYGFWAVEWPGQAPFIGAVGFFATPDDMACAPSVELAWRLDAPYWGQGLAPEAARAAIDDLFARTDLAELLAFTTTANRPSRRVMEKLGMTHDPAEDFDHPAVPADSPVRAHVLYRLRRQG